MDNNLGLQITYIITTWNRKDTLLEHLEILRKQTWGYKFEVIVCVDGSTDGTQAMLDTLPKDMEKFFLKWYDTDSIDRATPSKARNIGIRHASGELIIFADDDCMPNKYLIAAYASRHQAHTIQVGYRSSQRGYLDKEIPVEIEPGKMTEIARCVEDGTFRAGHFTTGSCAMSLYVARTPARDGSIGFDERFSGYGMEDNEFSQRLNHYGYKFIWNPHAVVWHMNPSATNQQDPERKKRKLEQARLNYEKIMQEPYGKYN